MTQLEAVGPLGDVQGVARHADPGTTTDLFDRLPAYVVVAFVAVDDLPAG